MFLKIYVAWAQSLLEVESRLHEEDRQIATFQ